MKAEDTVMKIKWASKEIQRDQDRMLLKQAEISFKAGEETERTKHDLSYCEKHNLYYCDCCPSCFEEKGIKEVVEWVNAHLHESPQCSYRWCFGDRVWQAQLKKWDIT